MFLFIVFNCGQRIITSYKCNCKVTAVSFALLTLKIGSWIGKKSLKSKIFCRLQLKFREMYAFPDNNTE